MTNLAYTGIGSRKTPDNILMNMTKLAYDIGKAGYTLRSGGADGADTAFENGAKMAQSNTEIYLPWKHFNQHTSPYHHISVGAYDLAAHFHPAWNKCSDSVRKLHARNCYQVLGYDLHTLSKFVLCWTPYGNLIGGTSQAIRIAMYFEIPIINLGKGT